MLADLEAKVAQGMGWIDLQATPSSSAYWGLAPSPSEGRHPVPAWGRTWEASERVMLHAKRWGWFVELRQTAWYTWQAVFTNHREQERQAISEEALTMPEALCKAFCKLVRYRDGCMSYRKGAMPIRRDEDIPDVCVRCGKSEESHP